MNLTKLLILLLALKGLVPPQTHFFDLDKDGSPELVKLKDDKIVISGKSISRELPLPVIEGFDQLQLARRDAQTIDLQFYSSTHPGMADLFITYRNGEFIARNLAVFDPCQTCATEGLTTAEYRPGLKVSHHLSAQLDRILSTKSERRAARDIDSFTARDFVRYTAKIQYQEYILAKDHIVNLLAKEPLTQGNYQDYDLIRKGLARADIHIPELDWLLDSQPQR